MAAVNPRPVADAAAALKKNLATARELISEPDASVPAMISAGGTPESRPPWNALVAYALTDAHAGVRHLETGLQRAVSGEPRPRGGSDGSTGAAISSIVRLAEAVGKHQPGPERRGRCRCDECRITRMLNRWSGAVLALPAVDELIRWQPIRGGPRLSCDDCWATAPEHQGRLAPARACKAHARPPACPYCDTFSLRAAPDRYLVACFNEECEDEDGNAPVGRLEASRVNGEPLLVWYDGRIQSAA